MTRPWAAIFCSVAVLIIILGTPSLTQGHKLNPEFIEKIAAESTQEHSEMTVADPRGEERTFASFPEWYIVYSADEYASFVSQGGLPSQFPYFKVIGQYWDSVDYTQQALEGREIDPSTGTVLKFIGASFTFENLLIGGYEKTIGRISEALNFFEKSEADVYTDQVSKEYAQFLLHAPWYDFPYFSKLPGLWSGIISDISIRSLERRVIFTLGYGLKGLYGKITATLSHSSLGMAEPRTHFTTEGISSSALEEIPGVEIVEVSDDGHLRATAPRYRAFKSVADSVVLANGKFLDIQGNGIVILTVISPTENACLKENKATLFAMPLVTKMNIVRVALQTEVSELHTLMQTLMACGLSIEHIYDY